MSHVKEIEKFNYNFVDIKCFKVLFFMKLYKYITKEKNYKIMHNYLKREMKHL